MNGLWPISKHAAGAWDFTIKENGRPVNLLIVGEKGNGEFGYDYAGSDHVEISSFTVDNEAGHGNAATSLPIKGGSLSHVGTRRLELLIKTSQ